MITFDFIFNTICVLYISGSSFSDEVTIMIGHCDAPSLVIYLTICYFKTTVGLNLAHVSYGFIFSEEF